MRLFVLGVPHTVTSPQFCSCAFTMKVWNLCRMMMDRGHEVVHFGNEGSHPACAEQVNIMTSEEWARVYRHPGDAFYDTDLDTPEKQDFHRFYAERLHREIAARLTPALDTIVCVTWGGAQRDAVIPLSQRALVVETGIGYTYSWADFRVFESYAWLNATLGREQRLLDPPWYWVVIPNAFDSDCFEFRARKDDYFLYLGRIIESKGVRLAVDIAEKAGRRIVLAGQGDPSSFMRSHVEYKGPLDVAARRSMLAGAQALICPTYYVEPFGGVNIEAQMSGTPVIASDHGAFAETVLHGVTGYRCRTFEQFEFAARHVSDLHPEHCRAWAMNYSLQNVAPMYEEYFRMLLDLAADGFYTRRPGRASLDWLCRRYPAERPYELNW